MKQKEKQSLRGKSVAELEKMLSEKEQQASKSRADMFRGKVKNIRTVKTIRDEIARIKTLIQEKQLQGGITK